MLKYSRHARRLLTLKPITKVRKLRAADDAETRCGHSVKYRYGTMFDILVIAQFVLYPEISRAQDLRYNVRILR